jgi:hypothetical protein
MIDTIKEEIAAVRERGSSESERHDRARANDKVFADHLAERVAQVEQTLSNQQEHAVSMRGSFVEEKPKATNSDLKSQNFISIINRIDEVERNLNNPVTSSVTNVLSVHQPRRSLITQNKIVKSNVNLVQPKQGVSRKEARLNEFQQLVFEKLASIEKYSLEKIFLFEKEISRFANKAEVVD